MIDFHRVFGALCALCALALVSPSLVLAADFEEEPGEVAWKEVEAPLPPFPEEADWIPFKVGAVHDTKFYVDGKSVSMGGDDVIRYSLVVVGSGGARNVSFEGMRCGTGERRSYAFGHADRTWSKARSSQWVRIAGTSNNHYVALYSDYFCAIGKDSIRTPEDARRALLYGQ